MSARPDQLVRRTILLFWLAIATSACVQLAGYDQKAYENATSLKPATLAMVAKSGKEDSFAANAAATEDLLVKLSAAYEYANGIEFNNEAAKNWRDLIGNDDSMIKGWLAGWQNNGSVSQAFLPEISEQLAEGFDTIICLEANKRQLSSCENLKRSQ